MPASPFDANTLEQIREDALRQAGFGNSPQADAMTALYLIAALAKRVADLETNLCKGSYGSEQ